MKKLPTFAVAAIFVGTVLFLRFVVGGNEDTWICQNNQWIKHGNPSSPIPTSGCGTVAEKRDMVIMRGNPKIAENFIKDSPTYKDDGSDLVFVSSQKTSCDDCFTFVFTFRSREAGFGDRSDKIVAQVITPHEIVVEMQNGQVTKAIIDSKYDELNQKLLSQ